METRRGQLIARHFDGEIEVGNDHVRIRLIRRDGGYAQEFYAADRATGGFRLILSSIHKNLIPASEHRACASPMIAGDRPHLFAVSRESLRMVYSSAEVIRHDEQAIVARLTGSALGHALVCDITLKVDADWAHVLVTDEIERHDSDPLIEYSMNSYAFIPDGRELQVGEDIDYAWTPCLRPSHDHVIGDSAFHSPAVIVQKGHAAAALVADLDVLSDNRAMPCSLDLDLKNGLLPAPLLSYGFCGYERTPDGRYFRHDITMAKRLPTNRLVYGYHLFISADCKPRTAHRRVSRFLWTRYGRATLDARSGARRPASLDPSTLVPDSWAAHGLYALASARDDSTLGNKARCLHDMAMAVPPNGGLFPTRFDRSIEQWTGCRIGPEEAKYHSAECSVQLSWMLKWYQWVSRDPEIIRRARAYADFLISARLKSGAIPSWFGPGQTPLAALRSSAETAASAMFLAELASVTGLAKYAQAAEKSAKFVLTEIGPKHAFADSLCFAGPDEPKVDPHSGARLHGGWALLWATRMCLELHSLTGCRRYVDNGSAILDQLCLLQSVGIKGWLRDRGMPGVCVRANVGARPDMELTAEFARCSMDYGALTGERDYFERGAAALAAALSEAPESALSQARIAATAALVRARYGGIFIHVGRKWAVTLHGPAVSGLEMANGTIGVDTEPATNGFRDTRVVFTGMRGRSYKVRINGRCEQRTREEMEAGIPLPQAASRETVQPDQPAHREACVPQRGMQLSFDA